VSVPDFHKQPQASAQKAPASSTEIDWKGCLNRALVKQTTTAIEGDRFWAQLCDELRAHCPETEWYFINACTPSVQPTYNAHFFETWVRHFVAHTNWPFPKFAIINRGSLTDKFHWTISVPGTVNLPLETFGLPLEIMPLVQHGYSSLAIKFSSQPRAGK
jgi:hypothetical protein